MESLDQKTQNLAKQAIVEDKHLHALLDSLQEQASSISVYRPLAAYRRYCEESKAITSIGRDIEAHAKMYVELGTVDHGGDITNVLAMLGSSSLSLQHVGLLRHRLGHIDSLMNTKAAFAFGMFSLYVAILSLLTTIVLGVLSLR